MTYFEQTTKKVLQEYQRRATETRKHNYALKCRIAFMIWNEFNDIHRVSKYFGITRDAAYKLVRKGKQLYNEGNKNGDDNSSVR